MKIKERAAELIFGHAKVSDSYNEEVVYILSKIQEDIKNALLHVNDLNSLKRRQNAHKEIERIITLITEDRDNYDEDLSVLDKVEDNFFD
ncbi:hypothetical protein CHH57_02300 [Niallia circulans]|uniref:Uncharacterized protein n=1 Tax=Niallia circulans TaxID=1397 RepID=A0AA91TV88_NIACI|nr:hypothetical protein [Niallia circulans]PAD84883.1 hypothetical protein CHH57_02300 [Niallia circulans]